ncbi:hypothetical protein [Caulobacter sp. S45]|uniref:hypothetical protein n=1 Tax=Caulobacter sp. S45 TaxID=1641861 RepID=UPI00131EA3CF|nr:hypothetical protein [Caulobacter sp. S45]
MAGGWLVGVLVEIDHAVPLRHFYAVAQDDQARAEWAAADRALGAGVIASSPHGGVEPVEGMCRLSPAAIKSMGLAAGQVKALGWKWPRRWLLLAGQA